MDDPLPFCDDFDFFVAHYLPNIGLRDLALLALTSKAGRRNVLRLVALMERAHLTALAASVRPGTNGYWRIRYLQPATRPHLQYGTLVWSNVAPQGLVRITGYWTFFKITSKMKMPVAPCESILLLGASEAYFVDVTNIEHYAILAPALEVAVARMRLKEVQTALDSLSCSLLK